MGPLYGCNRRSWNGKDGDADSENSLFDGEETGERLGNHGSDLF